MPHRGGQKLYLHVGYRKTGSSFLQSLFAINSGYLQQCGIYYPISRNALRRASSLHTTTGNIDLKRFAQQLPETQKAANGSDVLLSSELAFEEIRKNSCAIDVCRNIFDVVDIILLIRNPVEHFISDYIQDVKVGGGIETLDEAFEAVNFTPPILRQTIEFLDNCISAGVNLSVYSYDIERNRLAQTFAQKLQLCFENLSIPHKRVNRGLTFFEVESARVINAAFGRKIGAAFCEALIHQKPSTAQETSTPIAPSRNSHAKIIDHISPQVDALKQKLIAAGAGDLPLDWDLGKALNAEITRSNEQVPTSELSRLQEIELTDEVLRRFSGKRLAQESARRFLNKVYSHDMRRFFFPLRKS